MEYELQYLLLAILTEMYSLTLADGAFEGVAVDTSE